MDVTDSEKRHMTRTVHSELAPDHGLPDHSVRRAVLFKLVYIFVSTGYFSCHSKGVISRKKA